ncbi:MAG: hypothetical protein IKF90_10480 [Parasporobacterium sp.]|nr:hypothetical protein [Parasporobacterium sp.]
MSELREDDNQPFSCTAVYNADCYDSEIMKKVTREYLRQLKAIMKDMA